MLIYISFYGNLANHKITLEKHPSVVKQCDKLGILVAKHVSINVSKYASIGRRDIYSQSSWQQSQWSY